MVDTNTFVLQLNRSTRYTNFSIENILKEAVADCKIDNIEHNESLIDDRSSSRKLRSPVSYRKKKQNTIICKSRYIQRCTLHDCNNKKFNPHRHRRFSNFTIDYILNGSLPNTETNCYSNEKENIITDATFRLERSALVSFATCKDEPNLTIRKGRITQNKFDRDTIEILNSFLLKKINYPYANRTEIDMLSKMTSLTPKQIKKWLSNKRLRDLRSVR
ncbi:hypothetical protein GJ496_011112 [Pomphorhynchus laevis]|nr:hypothetical protein GJ496_011111 [Pomphorhynchus laevis]KAI0988328.1 hypothetical protein GJ496_011112 [Pomphorhynchus laevis]